MKGFSDLITSVRLNESVSNDTISQADFDAYDAAVSKTKRSKQFTHAMWLIRHDARMLSKAVFDAIVSGKDTSTDEAKDLHRIITKLGDEAKLLPQNLTAAQRQSVIDRRVDANDYTLDLESQRGRNEIAKKYAPLIEKIVNQFTRDKKCILSKEELRSAGYMGLVNAMNDYKNPDQLAEMGKSSKMSFTTYAAYRIQQQMLNDMTTNGHNVEISKYYQKKREEEGLDNFSELSIDAMFRNSDDDQAMAIDRFLELSEEPDEFTGDKQRMWRSFCKSLEQKFSARDCSILYRVWGVNNYKPTKVKDIAREFNISSAAVVQAMTRMYKWAKNDPSARECLSLFESMYVCNMIVDLYEKPQSDIIESFLQDDIYMMFESANRWRSADVFRRVIDKAMNPVQIDAAMYIYNILRGADDTNQRSISKYMKAIVMFLENVYPERTYKKAKTDDIINALNELKTTSLSFNIQW